MRKEKMSHTTYMNRIWVFMPRNARVWFLFYACSGYIEHELLSFHYLEVRIVPYITSRIKYFTHFIRACVFQIN